MRAITMIGTSIPTASDVVALAVEPTGSTEAVMEDSPLAPTTAAAWQGKIEVEGTDLALPSGNVARVKQISPQAFIVSGLIPDPLTGIIRSAINSKQGLPPSKLAKMSDDPEMLVSAMEMFDRVLVYVVISPTCEMPPPCEDCKEYYNNGKHDGAEGHSYLEGPRDPDVLYADTVDMDDKLFIFQWCMGGTRDTEKFREELQATMGSVSNSKVVQRSTKRAPRRK